MATATQDEIIVADVTSVQDVAPLLPTLANALNQRNPIGGVSGHIEVQRAIAEVQTAVLAALAVPRDESQAREKLLRACQCLPLAKRALWGGGKGLSRGGQKIEGPSIHLAKEIARVWRNIDYALIEHSADLSGSEYEAVAWDKEANTKAYIRFKVAPVRYSNGDKLTKPQEIAENAANIGARKLRSCILALVPAYIVEEAVEACKATIAASIQDVEDSKKRMLTGFAKFRVNQVDLEHYLEKSWDDISAEDVADLLAIYQEIKAGEAKPSDYFSSKPQAIAQEPPLAAPKPAEKPVEKPIDKPVSKPAKPKPEPQAQKSEPQKQVSPPPVQKPTAKQEADEVNPAANLFDA